MCAARAFTFAAMPPKQLKDASVFSLVTSWMQPKPNTEHSKTDDKTPSPTEVADSSQGSEKPEKDNTPAEVVDSTAFDYETWFEQNATKENDGSDDGSDVDFDELDTEEVAAIAEAMVEAAALNTTLHCHLGAKRPREEEKATAVAAPPEEQPEGSGVSCKPYPSRPNFWPQKPIVKLSNCQVCPFPFVLALGGAPKVLDKVSF